jgi:hypothetical protein
MDYQSGSIILKACRAIQHAGLIGEPRWEQNLAWEGLTPYITCCSGHTLLASLQQGQTDGRAQLEGMGQDTARAPGA